MDKQLLKAYIKTIVEDEVKKILPEMLSEAISEIKEMQSLQESSTSSKKTFDKGKLSKMMGISQEQPSAKSSKPYLLPEGASPNVDPEVAAALNKDYSQIMKALKIV